MSAVWMRARTELARSRAWISIALLVGLVGGAALAAAAGARRTASAYDRFLASTNAADFLGQALGGNGDTFPAVSDVLRAPGVADAARVAMFSTIAKVVGGPAIARGPIILASPDGRFGASVNRMKILTGRAADPAQAAEVVVGYQVAIDAGLGISDSIELRMPAGDRFYASDGARDAVVAVAKVVGIGIAAGEFEPLSGRSLQAIHATPAFYRAHASAVEHAEAIAVRLAPGAAVEAVQAGIERGDPGTFEVLFEQAEEADAVRRSIQTESVALWLLAGVLSLAVLAVIGQAIARHLAVSAEDDHRLLALGMSPAGLRALGMARAGAIAVAGSVLGPSVAVALSPLAPIGRSRLVEPVPGPSLDTTALAAGGAAIGILVLLLAAGPVWAMVSTVGRAPAASKRRRPSTVVAALSNAALPPSAVVGTSMWLARGRGRSAVPVRASLAAVVLGIAALVTSITFRSSLEFLFATPRLSGWNWDTVITTVGGGAESDQIVSALRADPAIGALAIGSDAGITVDGVTVPAFSFEPVSGSIGPTVVEGRAPGRHDEIALAADSLRALRRRVGETVEVTIGPSGQGVIRPGTRRVARPMRIVGRVVLPSLSDLGRLGEGASLTFDALRTSDPSWRPDVFYVRFAPGVDEVAEAERLRAGFGAQPWERPADLVNVQRIDTVPLALAAVLGAMAAATLAHILVTAISRRRRDLAIFKTLGFVRIQVLATVGWHASTFVSIALVLGVPLGMAGGAWAWRLFAERLGVAPETVVPLWPALLTVPAAIVLANLIAFPPARPAVRLLPAVILRAE